MTKTSTWSATKRRAAGSEETFSDEEPASEDGEDGSWSENGDDYDHGEADEAEDMQETGDSCTVEVDGGLEITFEDHKTWCGCDLRGGSTGHRLVSEAEAKVESSEESEMSDEGYDSD